VQRCRRTAEAASIGDSDEILQAHQIHGFSLASVAGGKFMMHFMHI
jgi:hypothetical protein